MTARLLSPAQVAAALGVSRRTVVRLIERGVLPSAKLIGSALRRVRASDLDAYQAASFEAGAPVLLVDQPRTRRKSLPPNVVSMRRAGR